MEDLFEREQRILDTAVKHMGEIQECQSCGGKEYKTLVKEYGRLLKQMRRIIKLSDKTTVDLNTSKLDLLDKVHYDVLTGIYNRRYMEERFAQLLGTLSRSQDQMLSVLMLDIDYFKKYNDTYGHNMGDYCLKIVAETITKSVTRTDDFAARYGGEEFIVVLPNTDKRGACVMAERIIRNVHKCGIPHEKSTAAECVTLSIGITTGRAGYPHMWEQYIRRADEALYLAKQGGRDRFIFLSFKEAAV